jgi:hypothetical protein
MALMTALGPKTEREREGERKQKKRKKKKYILRNFEICVNKIK